jgi:hypothetical protein
MKKIIKITEQQLGTVIKRSIEEKGSIIELEEKDYPSFMAHWENKFEKSVEILLKTGHSSDELIEKIKIIESKNNKQI